MNSKLNTIGTGIIRHIGEKLSVFSFRLGLELWGYTDAGIESGLVHGSVGKTAFSAYVMGAELCHRASGMTETSTKTWVDVLVHKGPQADFILSWQSDF